MGSDIISLPQAGPNSAEIQLPLHINFYKGLVDFMQKKLQSADMQNITVMLLTCLYSVVKVPSNTMAMFLHVSDNMLLMGARGRYGLRV